MLKSDLQYELPSELIADVPADRRDASRLLVLERSTGRIRHERFTSLPELLPPGALLVFNDTRVLPARLNLQRATGGQLEALFLQEAEPGVWEVMMTGAARVRPGERLAVAGSSQALILVERTGEGTWRVRPEPVGAAVEILERCGGPPLPPYILRQRRERASRNAPDTSRDRDRYQTVYARRPGAVAAPTAGLHFTPELLATLRARSFEMHFVTLHVGVGTFAPIRVENLAEHEMHAEWYECPPGVADAVSAARAAGRPVVAVGTTSVRVLETCAQAADWVFNPQSAIRNPQPLIPGSGWTKLFIYPPYDFKAVDLMITNFHLPESTLLAMVFAFAGRDRILAAYREAVSEGYRFFSYGDAMLIL